MNQNNKNTSLNYLDVEESKETVESKLYFIINFI